MGNSVLAAVVVVGMLGAPAEELVQAQQPGAPAPAKAKQAKTPSGQDDAVPPKRATMSAVEAQAAADTGAWSTYCVHKRTQVSDVCGLWAASWRPRAVSGSYLKLQDDLMGIDTSKCSRRVRLFIYEASRICSDIAVLITLNGTADAGVKELLQQLRRAENSMEAWMEPEEAQPAVASLAQR